MNGEIKPLTSFRGIAAFMVLIYHVRVLNDWNFIVDDYTAIISRGYLWVDFFFILSGFILAYVYGSTFDGAFGRADYLNFLRRRLLRIYPLHLATLLLFVPLVAMDLYEGRAEETPSTYALTFIHNLLLVQSWHVDDALSWNKPSWSISAEWAAYLLFPLFFFIVYRLRLLLASAFVGLGLACLYVMMLLTSDQKLDIHFDYGVLRCYAGFCLGILVYRVYEGLHRRATGAAGELAIARDRLCLLVLALIAILLHAPVHDIWLLPAFALLILGAALNRGTVKRALETPVLYGLGLISYSLYMTHWFVLDVTLRVRDGLGGGEPGTALIAGLMVAMIVATIGLSVITYRYVEQPFRRWPWRLPRLIPALRRSA